MKLHLLLCLSLGTLGLAQTAPDTCQCPLVSCTTGEHMEMCRCINTRELRCRQLCPTYVPTFAACLPASSTNTSVDPTASPCVCEEQVCAQTWPESCLCTNEVAQSCYDKCGGPQPTLQTCSASAMIAREAEPEVAPDPAPEPDSAAKCTCEETMCIQMWPNSCWCANAATQQCYKKCGGKKPELQKCPPQPVNTLTTQIQSDTTTPTPISLPQPINTHTICGGGRANFSTCGLGETCITDPYTPGCGPACDQLGICVQDKMCGGFAGLPCEEEGQVCHDDPRDDCDPQNGGADCGGVCVWPHKSLHGDVGEDA